MIQKAYVKYLKNNFPQYLAHYYERKYCKEFIVNEFSCKSEEEYIEQINKKDIVANRFLQNYIDNCIKFDPIPLFNKIEIETINMCNNSCSFCPVNRKKDPRKPQIMSQDLFKNIILQLEELRYEGSINLFSNNEPLLDPFLVERLKFAREHLPKAYIFIYTNGLLLTEELFKTILPYVDFIYINNYNNVPELLPQHQKIKNYLLKENISPDKVEIHLRNINECLSTRAGQSPNRIAKANLTSLCILPFSQIVVRPDGKISFCCNDAYGMYTMGDVNISSLTEIWHGEAYNISRKNMLKGRSVQKPCNQCDMLFIPLAHEKL